MNQPTHISVIVADVVANILRLATTRAVTSDALR